MLASASEGPFRLLHSLERAEQVLLLTYTAGLDFFERRVLGTARELEAATAVIADAAMVYGEPLTVRGSGVRYLDCRALCPGGAAFHPKLIVACGAEGAAIAIGSGNLGVPGWHTNEELWTVIGGDRDGGPETIAHLAGFLGDLAAGPVDLPDEGVEALRRSADLLASLPAEGPGPRLVSSLGGRIVDQLPEGPVDELVAYAPFHDRRLDGLTALVKRLQPRRLTVHVQPQTRVDGELLSEFLERHRGRLVWCAPAPYRHAKLVEWTVSGRRWALTGSPNLSTWALLRAVGEGGNLELGVIDSIPASLAPEEAPPPGAGLAVLKPPEREPAEADEPSVLLLSATLEPGGTVALRLSSELGETARLQAFSVAEDTWRTVPDVELAPGTRRLRVPAFGLEAGLGLRARAGDWVSNTVFVCDPEKASSRPWKRVGKATGTPVQIFEDGRLNDLFEDAIALAAQLARLGGAGGGPTAGESGSEQASRELSDYLAACAAVADEATIDWALVRPAFPSLGDGLETRSGGLSDETGDTAAEGGEDSDPPRPDDLQAAIRRAGQGRRRKLKRFCEEVVRSGSEWPHLTRAMGARYVLNAIAAELWPDDEERSRLLVGLVETLAAGGEEATAEDLAAEGSYAAICLEILDAEVEQPWVRDEATVAFESATRAAAGLLDHAEESRIEALCADLRESFAGQVEPARVWELVVDLRDPPAELELAARRLAEGGTRSRLAEDGALELLDPLAPGLVEWGLVQALGFAECDGPLAARAHTEKLSCRAVWHKPWLVVERSGDHGSSGKAYELGGAIDLRGIAGSWSSSEPAAERLPRPVEEWMPGKPVPARAAGLLELS